MSANNSHNYPKLHNAMWPGLVGKGGDGAEPFIDLDTMLDLTAAAQVERRQVRWRRPLSLRPAHRYRHQRRRLESGGRQDRRQGVCRRLGGRAGLV